MYTILLTDDEKIVIESLKLTLTKNFSSEISVLAASSGAKALEIVRSQPVDIIFMDIRMPGLNGLETVSLIKQINPNAVIIIVTAYDQFQYAQEALNLGAYKYLTKPVNRELLVQTVRSAMTIIDSRHQNLSDSIELHEKLSLVSTMVESDFIYSCIFNNKNTDFSDYLEYFGINDCPYFMITIEVPELSLQNRSASYEKIRDILVSKARCIIGSFMENKIVAFFPLDSGTEENQRNIIEKIFLFLSTNISSRIKIGVSDLFSDISDTQTAYNNSLSALNKNADSGGLTFFSQGQAKAENAEDLRKIAERLIARLRAEDSAGVKSLCAEYVFALFALYGDLDKIRNNLFELLVNVRNVVYELDSSYKNPAFDSIFSAFSAFKSREEFEAYVIERAMECLGAISAIRNGNENPVIKKACDYITAHLNENFGLEELASIIGVSPYYLSRLFKEEKGENFINYVTSLRLEKAKKLLEDSSLIIKEITASVGYSDQNYFAKLFRQKYGLSPSEYRESIFCKS